jgi:sialate O-acetylesterase
VNRILCLLPLLFATGLRADVVLAPLFTDHAVLQQGKPIPIWGTASPGETVTVLFHGETVSTKPGPDGRWLVRLKPAPATAEPADLVVTGKNQITLHDIVVGEVWLASGQSNMELRVCDLEKDVFAKERASADYPLIRHIKIARASAAEPQTTAQGKWEPSSSETVGIFTAAGYFFARDIYQKLKVPVGIINSSYGGSAIEAWLSPASFSVEPSLNTLKQSWAKTQTGYPGKKAAYDQALATWTAEQADAKAKGEAFKKRAPAAPAGPDSVSGPSNLYNGMIHPLLPVGLRGVLWYQGEANTRRAAEYHKLFAALITGWRKTLDQGDVPFYWVQLPNCAMGNAQSTQWAFLREAQDQRLSLPATGEAITIDIGNPLNIHPRNKQDVGHRLALIALAQTYGQQVVFSSPRFAKAVPAGTAIKLAFTSAEGLKTRDGSAPLGFEIAGADKKFVPAQATLADGTITVSAASVPAPVAVRYAWCNSPETNLYNAAGLPLAPFRTDDWAP